MAIDDFADKAKETADKVKDFAEQNAEKVKDALKSEQAEKISDKVLDGVAGFANKITGGKHADKVEDVRKNLDDKLGNQ